MEEITQSEAHLTSAAAFVEGGIQDACDDACSICLEAFCESDPSSLTSCKHEFHLQCILDWCQRSSQCPMCWQPLSLKDPTSQELLEAVEHERSFRLRPSRNTTIFRHPTLGDFELQHLPIGTNDAELEEHIIQQLAAAAAMGRRQIARREGQRNRSSGQGRPQFLVFSSHPNMPTSTPISSSPTQIGVGESVSPISISIPSSPTNFREDSPQLSTPVSPHVQANSASASTSGSAVLAASAQGNSSNIRSPNQSSTSDQDRAGPSDFQSFSESFKSKFNAVSMRYKESISKSTRGWKERFFSRNTTMADLGSEVRREVNAGIARVSQMMEHLETRDNSRTDNASVSNGEDHSAVADLNNQSTLEAGGDNYMNNTTATTTTTTNMQTSCATSSGST